MKIWIVDDHPLVGAALEGLLRKEFPDIVVSIESQTDKVQALLAETVPDILILDLNFFGEMAGYKLLRHLAKMAPQCKVIVLSMHVEGVYIDQAMRLGAAGYVVKTDRPEEIINAIRQVNAGEKFFSLSAHRPQKAEGPVQTLSARESEIAQLVSAGMNSKQIAEKLKISYRTVESHRQSIMRKLGAANTAQLIKIFSHIREHV